MLTKGSFSRYATRRTKGSGGSILGTSTASASQPSELAHRVPDSTGKEIRALEWISPREFLKVVNRYSDLILIDLREDAGAIPFPVPAAIDVWRVHLRELPDVLECLPTDRVGVFYGISDLSLLMITTSSRMRGHAPLYVLDFDPRFPEAA